jgi:hypothetical protein
MYSYSPRCLLMMATAAMGTTHKKIQKPIASNTNNKFIFSMSA